MAYAAPKPDGGLARHLRPAHALALACLAGAYAVGGPEALALTALLALLEALLSAASALFNAQLVRRLSQLWQRLFLTLGLLVAVVGVRFLVPIAIVCIAGDITPVTAINLLASDPVRYRDLLVAVRPVVNAFAGVFLLIVFLEFVFSNPEEIWIGWIERPLRRLGKIPNAAYLVALTVCLAASASVREGLGFHVLVAGVSGVIARIVVAGVTELTRARVELDRPDTDAPLTGRRAFVLLCYVELLNATVSIDSVATAFSLTLNAALIGLGLAIGAAYVRSTTVYLVRARDGSAALVFMRHGRYYAVAGLGLLLLVGVWHAVPDLLPRTIGLVFIVAAFTSSIAAGRRLERAALLGPALETETPLTRVAPNSPLPRDSGARVRAVALHIYLSDERDHAAVEQAVEAWLASAGVEVVDRDAPVLGSWSRRLWVRTREAAKSHAAREATATLVRAAEIRTYSMLDAQVTGTLMQSVAPVLASLQTSKDAVLRLGAILIVKVDWTPIVTQLSAAQQLTLDHHPELLHAPAQILRQLGLDLGGEPEPGEQRQPLQS